MHSNGEKSPQSAPVTVPKKKRGFCECCRETFEELQKVKAPLGPGSLQKLQRPLSGLDDHNVRYQYKPILEGRQVCTAFVDVVGSGICIVGESHGISTQISWFG